MITVGQYCALLVVGGIVLGMVFANIYEDRQPVSHWRQWLLWRNISLVCAALVIMGLIGCVYVASGANINVQFG